MATFKMYNQSAQEVGEIELADAVFGADIKPSIVKSQIVTHIATHIATKGAGGFTSGCCFSNLLE